MTSIIAPCLSALLLPPLLLLLLDSSAYEQVRVVCSLSGASALARSRRAAVAKTLLLRACDVRRLHDSVRPAQQLCGRVYACMRTTNVCRRRCHVSLL
jgi:hypothetical protein